MKKQQAKKMTLGAVKVAKLNGNAQGQKIPTTTVFTTTTHHTFDC
ncbi:hypothetical protein [Chitinophaga eiseniae]|nr:hypothetical protein [Chitinophaga eiseniae]